LTRGIALFRVICCKKAVAIPVQTENEADDVHINFYEFEYSARRIAEIEAMFSALHGGDKLFGELVGG
jgi:hypothetical protein